MSKHPELTDAEVDQLLERFDQTDPALQRRIVATFVARVCEAEEGLNELARMVRDCRALQKRYFASKSPQILNECRDSERRLDKAVDAILNPPAPDLFSQPEPDE